MLFLLMKFGGGVPAAIIITSLSGGTRALRLRRSIAVTREAGFLPHLVYFKWLPRMDSNHDKQIQNLQCYRYTTRQLMGREISGRLSAMATVFLNALRL
jgi:hypothetical protein